ncbi:PREDICTED: vesicle-associated protein 2-2-like isoform X2 [Lupinus angustifolius]|uniref:vesicle-associated protein 2-2-like isoform X2 n=1 Tax=Lupinus angustifolius TaxID=3871 RepID=UPI00092EB6F3|nr:PREDICTED: vesicle-associated protein 2-2-like isoform X2 [Lupinus angustifolius]
MNKMPLIEIEPKELQFIFELKKQSTCSVQLTNNTKHYVAFKVKTTSPKKYSVRPNVGILAPKSTCEFIVTMQAQREAPADAASKDKFLIQSTLVPAETTSEDVNSSLFVKDGSRYIEENKMKVALISPPSSSKLSPINGDFKNELDHKKVEIYSKEEIQSPEPMNVLKHEDDTELKLRQDKGLKTMNGVQEPKEAGLKVSKYENLNLVKDVKELKPEKAKLEVSKDLDLNITNNVKELRVVKEAESKWLKGMCLNTVKNVEELKPEETELKVSKDMDLTTLKNVEDLKPEKNAELGTVKNAEELKSEKEADPIVSRGIEELKLMEVIEQMKLKLDGLDSKLNESAETISRLTEERRLSNQETELLQEKLADLINKGPRRVQVGFPLLHVCMVAFVCVFLGYHLRC